MLILEETYCTAEDTGAGNGSLLPAGLGLPAQCIAGRADSFSAVKSRQEPALFWLSVGRRPALLPASTRMVRRSRPPVC